MLSNALEKSKKAMSVGFLLLRDFAQSSRDRNKKEALKALIDPPCKRTGSG